jgi:hypothetical protein
VKIQLVRITRSRKGHPIRAEQLVEADSLAVGRGAQCAVHLTDPRVALEHATIFVTEGTRRIAGVGGAALSIDGRLAGDLVLAPGARFEIGPYVFTVDAPPAGVDLTITYELVRPLPDELSEIVAKSRFSLDAGGASKRGVAWTLFIVVGVLFLLAPIFNAVTPPLRKLTADLHVSPDVAWNPGPLASGHQGLSFDCGACHKTPFRRVRDDQCLACHEKMPGHVTDAGLQAKLFGHMRCAQCHLDHRGQDEPIRADSGVCMPCHAEVRKFATESTLENVTDFAKAHPEFRLTVWRGPGPADVVRVKQSNKAELAERSNLKFPHDKHLKPGIKGPEGRETLKCDSCHTPDASQQGFQPVKMEKACQRCHELKFEPAITSRQVPHGSALEAWLLIQEFYANISIGDVPVDIVDTGALRRQIPMASTPIVTDEQRRRALAYARGKAQQIGVDLFEKRACVVCHDVRRDNKALLAEGSAFQPGGTAAKPEGNPTVPWTIAPVQVAGTWMPKARFDHGKHRTAQTECKDCHQAERSRQSSDVLIPDIASCRECHAGNTPIPGKVVSTCISCHDFHLAGVKPRPVAAPTGAKP